MDNSCPNQRVTSPRHSISISTSTFFLGGDPPRQLNPSPGPRVNSTQRPANSTQLNSPARAKRARRAPEQIKTNAFTASAPVAIPAQVER